MAELVPDPVFRRLPRCAHGVCDPGNAPDGYESDCGEPAEWEVRFPDGVMLVCDRHAREIEEANRA